MDMNVLMMRFADMLASIFRSFTKKGHGYREDFFKSPAEKVALLRRHLNPLICPSCRGQMRIIAFIEDPKVINKD